MLNTQKPLFCSIFANTCASVTPTYTLRIIAWKCQGTFLLAYHDTLMENTKKENSIAFGAPRREVESQPISQLDRPAVSQTETHTLGFLSVADTGPSSRENNRCQDWQWPNGNARGSDLMHGAQTFWSAVRIPVRTILQRRRHRHVPTRGRTADLKFCGRVHYHLTGGGVVALCLRTAWSLLSENF